MRALLFAVIFGGAAASAAAAEADGGRWTPNAPQVINFSLVEALSAMDEQALGGIFSFVPEDKTSMALAVYLMQDRKGLKLFLKKVAKDRKEAQGINGWDKEVLLYLVGMGSSSVSPLAAKPIPRSWMKRIQELSLEPALPLEVIIQRRALRN